MTEQALQSSLLRLVVLTSTGLASFLSDPSTKNTPQGLLIPSESSSTLPPASHFHTIRTQIRKDALSIFTEIGKKITNLSLALKKSSKADTSSPTSGLDAASITAAQSQIDALTSDLLPKLVFLSQKALKERSVYIVRKEVEDSPEAIEERKRLEEVAKEMGGQVMTGAELGLSSASSTYEKQANVGIGATWSHILRIHTQDVLQSIATLGEACMDSRTKKAVRAAQQARDRFDGIVASNSSVDTVSTREQCLAKTAAVWDACDQAIKSLPLDNISAVQKRWKERSELMQDGLDEMREAVEHEGGDDEEDDEEDDLGLNLSSMTLDEPTKKLLTRLMPLVRMGRMLHDKVGQGVHDTTSSDLDELDTKGVALAEAQDDLVAALLYGPEEVLDDDDEEEDEDEDHAVNTPATHLQGTRAVAELYLDAARRFDIDADAKTHMIVEEMVKLVDGVQEAEWPQSAP